MTEEKKTDKAKASKSLMRKGREPDEIEGKIAIAQIVNAVGLKGEVKLYNYSDDPDRYEGLEKVFLRRNGGRGKGAELMGYHQIEGVRYKGPSPILKLSGIDDRNASEALQFAFVYMDEDDLPELPEGEYYVKDLVGLKVVTEEGETLGTLKDIMTHTPQRLYVVTPAGVEAEDEDHQLLIPGVPEFILRKSPEQGIILVRLPEGLLELNRRS